MGNIIQVKYAAKQWKAMDETERTSFVVGTLIRISTITGWRLPEDRNILAILYREMALHMNEAWGNYNPEELAYAVRHYGTEVKDWGKDLNLSLIDQVMEKYADARSLASQMEESVKNAQNKPKQLESGDKKENLADWSTEWIELKNEAKTRGIENILIPVPIYDWLVRTDKLSLTVDEKKDLFERAKQLYYIELQETGNTPQDSARLQKLRQPGWQKDPDIKLAVANRAKILSVKELLTAEMIDL